MDTTVDHFTPLALSVRGNNSLKTDKFMTGITVNPVNAKIHTIIGFAVIHRIDSDTHLFLVKYTSTA